MKRMMPSIAYVHVVYVTDMEVILRTNVKDIFRHLAYF